jgi:hypothetical protein
MTATIAIRLRAKLICSPNCSLYRYRRFFRRSCLTSRVNARFFTSDNWSRSRKNVGDADGTISAKTDAPSRILRLTEYMNSSGAASYTTKQADEKNKISGILSQGMTASQPSCVLDGWEG